MRFLLIFLTAGMFVFWGLPVQATDMRLEQQSVERQHRELLEKALQEKAAAEQAARAQAETIKSDKASLVKAIDELKQAVSELRNRNSGIEKNIRDLAAKEAQLAAGLEETKAVNRELAGFVRSHARDLESLLKQSLQSALEPGRQLFLKPVILQGKFPSMDDIRGLSDTLFEQILLSGQVQVTRGPIVDRQGKEQDADILILGEFTAIYFLDKEVGFLLYSDHSQRFFALSKLPPARITETIQAYMSGRRPDVVMDITKGGAIRQLTHEMSLVEQIPRGGFLIWPILAILGLAVLIFLERILFFVLKQTPTEPLMNRIKEKIAESDWQGLKQFLDGKRSKLIPRVLLTAVEFRERSRQDMENALQEAILGEIPRIERFLSTLGMLAAIAPLMGLLGTVTGMINTFHVITHYGTSDPRMMAGGISEALVTTMLGLTVAIPIMLGHTLISRRVETLIQKTEEKAVAFVNLVFKNRNACAGAPDD